MGKPSVPIDPVADLKRRLTVTPAARHRACIHTWWGEHGFRLHPAVVGKRVAVALIEQQPIEAKQAGIVVLGELLGPQLRAADLPAFGRLFGDGHLAEPVLVDRFIFKVLVTLVDRTAGRREVARGLGQWRTAETLWQRRAACLAFVKIAPRGEGALAGLTEIILTTCATVVWSHERGDQTAVGWVLRELSRAEPERVEQFFRRHALLMSRECARFAVVHLPPDLRTELLAHHKRVTSLAPG
jgi:hypothetical protein